MQYEFHEEEKAVVDNFEVPVQCLLMKVPHSDVNNARKIDFHYHDYIEFLYGIDCDINVWCEDDKHILKNGELIVINSKRPHFVFSNQDESTYVVIKFMPQILYASEQSVRELKYILPFISSAYTHNVKLGKEEIDNSEIPALIEKIVAEWENKGFGYELAVRMYAINIVLWLLRYWDSHCNSQKSLIPPKAMASVQKAIEYAQNNYSTAASNSAADLCYMSHSYFSRLFKKVMGRSFTDYVNYVRISEAQRLLISTQKSITDISLDVGFSTTSYFIDKFRRQVHMTPKQFRQNYSKS